MANLSSFDLNLLRVLDALLRENSTVRAAAALGLSQPAVSAALGRLRISIDDLLGRREVASDGEHRERPPQEVSVGDPHDLPGRCIERPEQWADEEREPDEEEQLEHLERLLALPAWCATSGQRRSSRGVLEVDAARAEVERLREALGLEEEDEEPVVVALPEP